MNSSSSLVQDSNQKQWHEFMDIMQQRPIEHIGIIERRKRGQWLSYKVLILFHLKEKKK